MHKFTDGIKQNEAGADKLLSELGVRNKYLLEAHAVVDQAKFLVDRSNKSGQTIENLIERGEELCDEANKDHSQIFGIHL